MTETKKKRNKLLILVIGIWVGVCLGAVGVGAFYFMTTGGPSIDNLMIVEVEKQAPVFELEDMQGNLVNLEDLQGQIVVLNFWATWCGPCVEEMPMLERYQSQHPEILLIGINKEEERSKVQKFLDETGFSYLNLLDPRAQVAEQYRVMTLPSTFFIDENGMIRFQHIGVLSEDQFDYYLEEMKAVE